MAAGLTSYSIMGYNKLVADTVRAGAYFKAAQAAIKPGSIVVDIGTGTGVFAILACQLGASHVYAIEPSDVIEMAKKLAARNGFDNRIEFIQDVSTAVTLPRRADVILSDLRGVLPVIEHSILSLADARNRMLADGGLMIPNRDNISMALVNSERIMATHLPAEIAGAPEMDTSPLRAFYLNTWTKQRVRPEECLTDFAHAGSLDYRTIVDPNVRLQAEWIAERPGIAHGFCAWFDTDLLDGIGFSNSPSSPEVIYGQAFFPFREPVTIEIGDCINVDLHAIHGSNGYTWRWQTTVESFASKEKANFSQSTLEGAVISLSRLHRQRDDYVPPLDPDAKIMQLILELTDGSRSLKTIASDVAAKFPERFSDWQKALAFVGETLEKNR